MLPMHFGFGGGGMRFENGMGVFFRGSAFGRGGIRIQKYKVAPTFNNVRLAPIGLSTDNKVLTGHTHGFDLLHSLETKCEFDQ